MGLEKENEVEERLTRALGRTPTTEELRVYRRWVFTPAPFTEKGWYKELTESSLEMVETFSEKIKNLIPIIEDDLQ